MDHPTLAIPRRAPGALLALPLVFLLMAASCAPKEAPAPEDPSGKTPAAHSPGAAASDPADTSQWDLTPEAARTYYFLLLQEAQRQDNATLAARALDRLLELDDTRDTFQAAATFYWRQGELERTVEILRQGLQRHPGDHDMLILLAYTYFSLERPDDAYLTLQDAIDGSDEDARLRQELGNLLVRGEDFARAVDVLAAVPPKERNALVLYNLGRAEAGVGRRAKAIEHLSEAVRLQPTLVEAWAELAFQYELRKDFVAAEEAYARLDDMGEAGFEVLLRMVDLNLKLNNPEKALQLAQRMEKEPDYLLRASTSFLDQGFYEAADVLLAPLAPAAQDKPEVHFFLAVLAYEGKDDPRGAIAHLEQVPASNRYHDRALRFLAQLYFEQGRPDEALDTIRQGREAYPEDTEFYLVESTFHEDLGDLDQARAVLRKGLEASGDDTRLLYALGVIQEKAGDRDQALATMERIIGLEPDNADALNYVGYTLAERGRDLDRAEVLLSRAMELKPGNGYIVDSHAWLLFQMGRTDQAWKEIRRALELVEDDPVIWEHYGDIAKALGKTAEAKKGYRRAVELGEAGTLDQEALDRVRGKLQALD